MPRFFFDVTQNNVTAPDECGLEFADDNEACKEAVHTLCEMASELASLQNGRTIAMTVRSERGGQTCRVQLDLSFERPSSAERMRPNG